MPLLVLCAAACGHRLDTTAAVGLLERELQKPPAAFCCERIEDPSARAKCATSAEAQCGFATAGKATLRRLGTMGHGDVAHGAFEVRSPRGEGRCDAQFIYFEGDWMVDSLACTPAVAP